MGPNGQVTTVEAAYDVAGSQFCASESSTDAAFHTPPVTGGPYTGPHGWFVSLTLTGLTPGTRYCAGLFATNPSGTASVFAQPFTAGVPFVGAGNMDTTTAVGATGASVTGTVDPVGQATTYDVAYDTIDSTWCRSGGASGAPSLATQQLPLPFTDATYHPVTVTVSGLAPTTGYCLAVASHNASGDAVGAPTPLPAMPTLTVTVLPVVGAGSVTSSPTGISCLSTCSASFERGIPLTLGASAPFGASFAEWYSFHQGPGPIPASPPCANSPSATCTLTLSQDTSVGAQFNGPYSCHLAPLGSKLHSGTLYLIVYCDKSARITITGKLTEVPKTGKTKTFSLRPLRRTGHWWKLPCKLPSWAVDDLRKGASELLKLTLSYSWLDSYLRQLDSYLTQRTTATVTHLTN